MAARRIGLLLIATASFCVVPRPAAALTAPPCSGYDPYDADPQQTAGYVQAGAYYVSYPLIQTVSFSSPCTLQVQIPAGRKWVVYQVRMTHIYFKPEKVADYCRNSDDCTDYSAQVQIAGAGVSAQYSAHGTANAPAPGQPSGSPLDPNYR